MKLPVFEEIKVANFEVSNLIKVLHRYGVGQTPCFVYLNAENPQQAKSQIDHLLKAMEELDVHPQIPFPFYVITTQLKVHPVLPVVASEEDLPLHFYKKSKRLKSKEQSLLNRVRLVADKLANEDLITTDENIRHEMSLHKKLYRLTRETHFYEQILKKLKN